MTKPGRPAPDRRERLAMELRANLKRRKAKERGKDGEAETGPIAGPDVEPDATSGAPANASTSPVATDSDDETGR